MGIKTPAEELEKDIRDAISKCEALNGLSERAHFEAVDEALDMIHESVDMRLNELDDEEEDEDQE